MDRGLFKNIVTEDVPPPRWICDEDLPVTFSLEEKKQMQFRVIKYNYKIGSISKEEYLSMMKSAREIKTGHE